MARQLPTMFTCFVVLTSLLACAEKPTSDSKTPTDSTQQEQLEGPQQQQRPQDGMPSLDTTLTNLDEITRDLNLASHQQQGGGRGIRIAVLDNGFLGLEASRGKRLPDTIRVEPAPKNPEQMTPHGTRMAEIAYAVATGSTAFQSHTPGPEILLFNTNGYTNLVHAIDQVIARNVDIVLYSQVWEYGGNGNGTGFINAEVNRAIAAGVQWINAAGNFGRTYFEGPATVTPGGHIALPHEGEYVRFSVEREQTPVKIVVSWNDFTDSTEYRTAMDLDAELIDEKGESLAVAKLIQDGLKHDEAELGYGIHAREVLRGTLAKGNFRVRVTTKNATLPITLRVRIAIDGPGITMQDRSINGSIFIPADNPEVLTVGAVDVDYSALKRIERTGASKPEVALRSKVVFDNGEEFYGTSAATAIAVGALAAYQSSTGVKTTRALKTEILMQRIAVAPMLQSYDERQCLRIMQAGRKCPELPFAPWIPPVLRLP